jgi:outer membrane protein OmpA-like peptidoglycan-associated protein
MGSLRRVLSRPVGSKRVVLIGAAAVAALVGLYAAAGYWLAPRFIRDTLVERARAAGFDLRIGKARTYPFALSLELHDAQLATLDGHPVFSVQRAAADISAGSLFSRRWLVQRVALERPVLMAVPAIRSKAGASGSGGGLPAVELREAWITNGVVALPGVPRLENVAVTAHRLSTLGDAGTYEAAATLAEGGQLSSQGRIGVAPVHAQGDVRLDRAALRVAWRFLPERMGAAPPGTLEGSLAYRYDHGRLALDDLRATARLESGARLSANGAMGVQPFSADLALDGEQLPLALVQPLLPGSSALRIASGTLSGKGRLRLGGEQPRYEGSVKVDEGRIEDGNGTLLVAWQKLSAPTLELAFSPFALHADEIVAAAPRSRVAIDPKGRLNFVQAFAAGGPRAENKARSDIRIGRVRVEGGQIDFTDRSLASPFGTTVRELAGTVSGLNSAANQAARVRLDGRVGKYGDARVRGTVDLTAPSELTNVRVRLRNLALPDFTPYAVKFAGYRIEEGRLDAELHYRVNAGRLVGSNQLVFQQLKLGDKVQSASALDLPVELAVALLTDAQGRIDLAIPVSGNLKDPHFDIGGLVAKALGNTLRKVVSAPFRLLASVFGHGDEEAPQAVRFDAGSAQLAPPEEETAATLASALAERPQLELAIHAGYAAEADSAALKRSSLLRELAARAGRARAAAGASAPAAADPADPKIARAAERLYRQRGASARDLAALQPKSPGYGRRLVERLASSVELPAFALERLAQERARAVQRALVEHGAPAERVEIDSARESPSSAAGVPTSFELRPRQS